MPGTDLNITLPVVGTDSWPVWADRVTSALTTIINDIEAQVVTSEIFENADHDFNGFALTDVLWARFRQGNTTDIPTLGIGFKNGDLWACDGNGNQIQVSSGGVLAGVGNGFRGDTAYALYTASSSLYEFLDSSNAYDDVKAGAFKVANGAATGSITYAGAVDTTFSLPTTAAAGVSVLTINAAGQVAHNGTIGVGFTVNNANITLTGTARVSFPTRYRVVSIGDNGLQDIVAFMSKRLYRVPLQELERVLTARLRFNRVGGTTRLRIERVIDGAMTPQTLSTALTFLDVTAGGIQTQTLTLQTPYTYTSSECLCVTVEQLVGSSVQMYNVEAGCDA